MSQTTRPRITWVDDAKGIGIFLVVLGHVLRGLVAGRIIADGPAFRFVDSWIYTFHMPLFFLISGLFAGRQVDRDAGVFLRDKLATIAYPYLVWSTLQTLVQVATGRYTNHPASLGGAAGILVEPVMKFWFLYALFLISLVYYALRRLGIGPVGALAAFTGLWATRGWVDLGTWTPLLAMRSEGLYYPLGAVLNRVGGTERIERAPAAWLAPVVVVGYGIVAAWVARDRAAPPALALVLTLCGVAASMALAVLVGRSGRVGFVRVMGVDSLEIFVAHTIASAGIRIGLARFLKVDDPTIHIVLGTAGGIALPLLLSRFCRRHHAGFLYRFPGRPKGPTPGEGSGTAEGRRR